MKRVGNLFEKICSFENLYLASQKAFRGKKSKNEISKFNFNLESELFRLEEDLKLYRYQPSPYKMFSVFEPKERTICCSSFRDRVLHHAICEVVAPIFEKKFIFDTYACRPQKGTHKAIYRAQYFTRRVNRGGVFP